MKKLFTLTALVCVLSAAYAQKHDNVWLWGTAISFQDSAQYRAGNAEVNFSNGTFQSFAKFRNMPFTRSGAFWSDADGNLLLYSNGMQIKDTTGYVIENGDSINFGQYWMQTYPSMVNGNLGFPFPRGVIFLNHPTVDSIIYMFHELVGDNSDNYASRVKLTEIARNIDGTFYVVRKNQTISSYPIALANLAACKHGNGRDWWLLFAENNTNCIVKLLLTPDSIIQYDRQCIGDTIADGNGIKATFSLDGTKYANTDTRVHGTNIYDFDRCDGLLSNPKHIPALVEYDTSGNIVLDRVANIELSPNGGVIYVMLLYKVFQFDLASPQFPNGYDTIGVIDNVLDTTLNISYRFSIFSSTYGPDGVLYISPGNGQRYLCTINNPNGKGALCDFRLRNIELPKLWYYTAPNIPNYRLGRLIGSACDTVYSDIKPLYAQSPWLKVYPNPASDIVRFDYNWVEWETVGSLQLTIAGVDGRVVIRHEVPKYSSKQEVDVRALPAGVYMVSLLNEERQIAVGKLTKAE